LHYFIPCQHGPAGAGSRTRALKRSAFVPVLFYVLLCSCFVLMQSRAYIPARGRGSNRTWTQKQQDVDAGKTEQTQNTQVLREGHDEGAREKANENKGICLI
tara:strand:- start:221 stop:526 length:306 start_codon:yes stop_codon:yes gene_type:complete